MATGLAVFAAAYLLRLFVAPAAMWGDFVAPALAGFASSWFAPRRRVVVGTSMALPPAVLYGVTQTVCELTRARCDRVGAAGAMFLTAFTLVWNLVLCGGGAIAADIARSRLAAHAPSPTRQ